MYAAAAAAAVSAYGAIKGSQDQSDTLDYQARVQSNNAKASLIAAKLNADRQNMQFKKVQGQDIANYGASGVSKDSGSVLAVLGSNAEGAELDRQNILYGGQIRSINYENQSSVDSVAAGRATTAGYLSAVGSLASAGAYLYGARSSGGTTNNYDFSDSPEEVP